MVTRRYTSETRDNGNYGVPVIDIHFEERSIHGNGIAVKVYGEMRIAAKERIYAYELGLKTLQVLLLTVETGAHSTYHAQKYVHNKGEYDNYASIDIFEANGTTEMTAGRGPSDGSIWLNFMALGE